MHPFPRLHIMAHKSGKKKKNTASQEATLVLGTPEIKAVPRTPETTQASKTQVEPF